MRTYIISLDKDNKRIMGTFATRVTRLKTVKSFMKEAQAIKKQDTHVCKVFAISEWDFNQLASELNDLDFYKYLSGRGIQLI